MRCLVLQERVSQARENEFCILGAARGPSLQTEWQELIYTALRLEACSSGRGRLLQTDGSFKTRLAELPTHETGRLLKRYLWLAFVIPNDVAL